AASAPRRVANDFGGLLGPPNGEANRQLVSEKERRTTIVSSIASSRPPGPASSAADFAAAAVRSIGESAFAGSGSRCVICPAPTNIGVLLSSITPFPHVMFLSGADCG